MSFATKYLKNVKIKYDSVLKETGEIKEAFIITYNGSNLKETFFCYVYILPLFKYF